MQTQILLTLSLLSLTLQLISATNVICYQGTWSYKRPGDGQFNISDVQAKLCTHYIYAFLGLDSTNYTVKLLDESFDESEDGLASAAALRQINPNLKVLASIGGWNEGSANYSTMVTNETLRANFIASALEFVQDNDFDGLDIDWEYPARRDSVNPTTDKENFATLLKEWSEVFNKSGLVLTAAVSAVPSTVDISYDVPVLSEYLDSINVMTYDIHGAWDNVTGFNSPLYSSAREAGTEYQDFSINASIAGWIARGADPAKLAVGIPFYGRTTTLRNASDTQPGAPTTSTGGPAGNYTGESGFWGYLEIVEQLNAGGWQEFWDDEQKVPYAAKNKIWISYDNVKSIELKVEYVLSLGLGGVSIWSVDTDDRVGDSGTTYPLLNAINDVLVNNADISY